MAPASSFLSMGGSHFGRRRGLCRAAHGHQALLDVVVGQCLAQRGIERVTMSLRRAGRCEQAGGRDGPRSSPSPASRSVGTRWACRIALALEHHRHRAQRTRLKMCAAEPLSWSDHQVDLPAHQVDQRRCRSLVQHGAEREGLPACSSCSIATWLGCPGRRAGGGIWPGLARGREQRADVGVRPLALTTITSGGSRPTPQG